MLVSLLNKRIIIEKGVDTKTPLLSTKLEYEEYMQTYANVYVRSASARFGESEELLYTTEFTIWYTSKSKRINNKYRIKYNDQIYKIIEVVETEPRQALKIIAEHYSDGQ